MIETLGKSNYTKHIFPEKEWTNDTTLNDPFAEMDYLSGLPPNFLVKKHDIKCSTFCTVNYRLSQETYTLQRLIN